MTACSEHSNFYFLLAMSKTPVSGPDLPLAYRDPCTCNFGGGQSYLMHNA